MKGKTFRTTSALGLTVLALATGCKPEESKKHPTPSYKRGSDVYLLAQTIYGEARGSPQDRIPIGHTVLTRATNGWAWDGETIREVVTKPDQYKCFKPGAGIENYKATQNPEKDDPRAFTQCLEIAQGILSGRIPDPTGGATHFYEKGHKPPKWTRNKKRMRHIGRIQTPTGLTDHVYSEERWRQSGKRNR